MGAFEDVEEEERAAAEAKVFCTIAARCNYLQPDRPDVQRAVKECCRLMARPTQRGREMLKRIDRYLKGRPHLICRFAWHSTGSILDVHTDAN